MAKNVRSSAKPAKSAQKAAVAAKGENHELAGKTAPSFELPDQHGDQVSLKELTSRGNVVLYFYPKDMTPGCTTEACSFRDNIAELRALGAQVVGISSDTSASHQKFIDKYTLNFPLLSDIGNTVTKAYGVYKKKSLYGREFMGIERTTFVIDRKGKVRKAFPKVRVDGHTEQIIAALKELN
jgi:peroxiredoxin Q/BCP